MKFLIIGTALAGLAIYLYRKCYHDWQQSDHFHSKKEHTIVLTCTKCHATKYKIFQRS